VICNHIFIGYFQGDYIAESPNIEKPIVAFRQMDIAWRKELKKHFHPLINGGFRKLTPEESAIVCELLDISLPFSLL